MAYKKLPGFYPDQEEYQPGEELKDYLEEIYPPKSMATFDEMDNDLRADGELKNLVYESSILYILRRLVTTTEHFFRLNGENKIATNTALRYYLRNYTRYSDEQVNKLSKLLLPCMDTARNNFTDGDKNIAKQQKKYYQWACFVCGKEMNETTSATADHFWPRAMGGLSNSGNLRMVCQICNNNHKKDYINQADYHYEEIAISATDYKHYKGSGHPKIYEVAVFAKSNYCCEVCQEPAYRVGELTVGRIDLKDGWHYLNLAAFCLKHKPE
ncbi:MAG: endonuclease [Mucilaginibacter sp.]|nr:endonuclease [Mucilaginibacter sp.]